MATLSIRATARTLTRRSTTTINVPVTSKSLSSPQCGRPLSSASLLRVESRPNAHNNEFPVTAAVPHRRSFTTTAPPPPTTPPTIDRPFRILGIQQIAIGHAERDPLIHLWSTILGLPAHKTGIRLERENVVEDTLTVGSFANHSHVEIDLMTPIDLDAHPRVHTPPLHHVGLWVDDLRAAVDWMGERGVRFTPGGIRKGAAGHDICFIHPKGNEAKPVGGNGVLIELVQAPPAVIEAAAAAAAAAK